MSVTLKRLCFDNGNPFKLTLHAGHNSIRNAVDWVYLLEDESIIPHLHGSDLVITTGMRQKRHPDWLINLVKTLVDNKSAGLIINVGKFIFDIPDDVIDFCNKHDFPILTMPWDIRMTTVIQDFCTRIIEVEHETEVHDQAIRDAIKHRDNEQEYRSILSKNYDVDGKFYVIMIHLESAEGDTRRADSLERQLINKIRRFKLSHGIDNVTIGTISYDEYELMVLNNATPDLFPYFRDIILDVYAEEFQKKTLHMGVGIEVDGISNIYRSYRRARSALRMAVYRRVPLVRFEEMGFHKILFSVNESEVLYSYADDVLAPLDALDSEKINYIELLQSYIQNDRSLEKTASDLYLHRNTVNYRIQKLKTLLNSPLKTVEDLFPFQVALAIRDIQMNYEKH